MSIPTPHVLGLRKFTPGEKDSRGNVQDAWADPIDMPVMGVAPGAMDEPGTPPARDLSLIEWTVYAPPNNGATERDLVVMDGLEYRIDGKPRDWTKGPWPADFAGHVIYLKRAEG